MYIYHHLGLGDHIICNSIVRHYATIFDEVIVFCKNHNRYSVEHLYSDLRNVDIHLVNTDTDVNIFIYGRNDVVRIGFEYLYNTRLNFDEAFYEQSEIPFDYRWSKFYVNRNIESEKSVFDKYNIKENEYVFLHDDISRGYVIDRTKISTDLPIISPNKEITKNIFDYCYLLENANQIHCMDSSFKLIVDSIGDDTWEMPKFYHTYITGRDTTKSKLFWNIL
jgi:hypothetical protein